LSDYTPEYQAFWEAYPKRDGRKQGKKPGFAQWQKLSVAERRAAQVDVDKRNRQGGWGKYIRDAERYIRHRGWEDEWSPERSPAAVRRSEPPEPEYDCDKWTALANRLLIRYVRHARGLSESELALALEVRDQVVAKLSGPLDEEIAETGKSHDSVMTFSKQFLSDLDHSLGRKIRGRIIKGAGM